MKRTFTLLFALWVGTIAALAQAPAGYYNNAEGKSGSTLKASLNNIIDGHTEYSYSQCWDALKVTDRDPNNSSNVVGLYSGFSMNAAAEYANGAGWNREHVWAKSRGDFGTSQGAGTDLHHLRAEDVSTNSARNNRHFGLGNQTYVDGSGNYSGTTASKTNTSTWVWEPRDAVKGDVARMMFYMAVRYEGEGGEPDLELNNTISGNTDKSPYHASLDLLLQWHAQDPVDAQERARHEAIYGYQNNRNPFIDRPEFVSYIWGGGSPGGGGGGSNDNVTLALTTDNYPGETTWTLKNGSGQTVASGGPYSNANTTYNSSYSLADGTYSFTINDSYGDGICCSYGNGSFTWKEGSTTLTSGGSFSSSQTKTFTVGGGSSGGGGSSTADIVVTIVTDNYPSETTWQVRSGGQTVSGGGPYSGANSTYNKTLSLATGSYTFQINDSYGDGICCSYGNGSYTVKNGSTTLVSGGSFGSSESKGFSVVSSRGIDITVAANGEVTTTSPVSVVLAAYPNPAEENATLALPLKEAGEISLRVVTLQGQAIYQHVEFREAGRNTWQLDVQGWKAGMYLVQLVDAHGNIHQETLTVQ